MKKTKAHKILEKIDKLQESLEIAQSECKHKNVTETPGANTGNWDQINYYWTDYHCHDCDKRWTVDHPTRRY